MKVTHEGWLLFCPIWTNEDQVIAPKYGLEPLLWMATELQQIFNTLAPWFVQDFEPGFYLKVKPCKLFELT